MLEEDEEEEEEDPPALRFRPPALPVLPVLPALRRLPRELIAVCSERACREEWLAVGDFDFGVS